MAVKTLLCGPHGHEHHALLSLWKCLQIIPLPGSSLGLCTGLCEIVGSVLRGSACCLVGVRGGWQGSEGSQWGELISLGRPLRWGMCLRFQSRWGVGALDMPESEGLCACVTGLLSASRFDCETPEVDDA